MNLRDLQYLISLADTQHFSQAAERCFVSQPTLSGQIKKLEDELGVTLFERTKRSVEITPIGNEILGHARQILEQADSIRQLARAQQDPLVGPLNIGAIPSLSPYLLPLFLMPLTMQCPQMRLVLTEELTDRLLERLSRHEIDAALLATPAESPELESLALFEEPFWIACAPGHPLAKKREITQQDLAAADLLLLSEGHCLADQAMEICRIERRGEQAGMADLRASNLETLLQLVAVGFGCTLVPALAIGGSRLADSGIVVKLLKLPDAYRRVSLVFRRSFPRRQALEALAQVIVANLPDGVRTLAVD